MQEIRRFFRIISSTARYNWEEVVNIKRSLWLWQLFGFACVSFFGTLLHFLYEASGYSPIAALISGVNESTWEHMKLMFFPMFAFAVIESFFFGDIKGFWCIKLSGICLGLSLIPLIFYTYNGVVGRSPDFINIAIFFVSAAIAYRYEYVHMRKNDTQCAPRWIAIAALCVIGISFFVFTFAPPRLAIFKDPMSGGYGITNITAR